MYVYNNCDSDDLEKCEFHQNAVECGAFLNETGISKATMSNFLNESGVSDRAVDLMYPVVTFHWTLFVDPITSLILTMLILYTTLKLLRGNSQNVASIQSVRY